MKTMRLPETKPQDDRSGLWSLQLELLSMAESVLGPRDILKKIYQPKFTDEGPQLRNTPNLDGAFVELSRFGECYWPTVVYEMAHETVHLLDPIPGNTNNLEEGVAVAFSLDVQPSYGVSMRPSEPSYHYALQLVWMLPGGPLEAANRVRRRYGALGSVTAQILEELFPNIDRAILSKLAEKFVRNPN